jgi:hypothetical protein
MRLSPLTTRAVRLVTRSKAILCWLTLGMILGTGTMGKPGAATTPATAPAPLKQVLTEMDAAANGKNVQRVLEFYSPNFKHSDGLNRQTLEQALTQLWKQYPNLTYRTELQSWQQTGSSLQTETVTYITGTQTVDGQSVKLNATLRSRQRFENQKIVQQDVLSERNLVTSGEAPPTVKMTLPEQVRVGQEFGFDAIVQEPLGSDLLLGSVTEEPVSGSGYLKPATANLELLTSGGLFKVGKAPTKPRFQWISAVLVRNGGMTMVTQRMQVVEAPARPNR